MAENRSLDEFLDGTRAAQADDADGANVDDADGANVDDADGAETPAADPAAVTYAWAPEATCEACGAAAPRRWRDDGARVCADCKEW